MSRLAAMLAIVTFAVLPTAPARAADDDASAKEVKTGSFQIKIPERCKESVIATLIARMGWGTLEEVKKAGEADYNLSDETFEVYVPANYTGKEPYGLLVWVNPGPEGSVRRQWTDVLDKHKLIWVGANKSGNDRAGWIRLGMALDAARYMPTKYNIDKDRIMVSGVSGGGRCASMLDIAYPEVFTGGGIYIVGCNFYRMVELVAPTPGTPGTYYRRNFNKPKPAMWDLATKSRSHVFLTGDTDANREQTEFYYNAAKKDGFKHIAYIQVPGMGHQAPDAEWFEKALVTLEEGTLAASSGAVARGGKTTTKKIKPTPDIPEQVTKAAPERPVAAASANPATATITAGSRTAPDTAAEPDEPTKQLKIARLYIDNRLYNKAREKLKLLVKDHPTSPQAADAKKLLNEIGEK